MGQQVLIFGAAFFGSAVEATEALTIVLAVGLTRGWRAPLLGTVTAIAPGRRPLRLRLGAGRRRAGDHRRRLARGLEAGDSCGRGLRPSHRRPASLVCASRGSQEVAAAISELNRSIIDAFYRPMNRVVHAHLRSIMPGSRAWPFYGLLPAISSNTFIQPFNVSTAAPMIRKLGKPRPSTRRVA